MKKCFLCLAILTYAVTQVRAESMKTSGVVYDAQTNEPLIGVTVMIKGSSGGTVTDLDGGFTIEADAAGTLELSYVGYKTESIDINGRKLLGAIKLNSEAIALKDVTVTSQVAIQRKTPVAVSQVSFIDIEERLGTQEFVEVLKNTPGVHANKQGGGWGDAEIYMRGFSSENIGVMINGAPMNDMEWGGTYWSNWQGLSDVMSVTQTQRGLGASKVSSPTVGGTINIVTKGIDAKRGGSLSYSLGNDGYNKIAFSVSTGLTKKGWAITVLGSRTWGDGYVQGTEFVGYTYFANISKRISEKHQLSLTGFGAPQWHFQRDNSRGALTLAEYDKVKQYMTGGMHWTRYNPTYGVNSNGKHISSNLNEYHKPQISLNHIWQISHKASLSSSVYASFGRGNGIAGEDGKSDLLGESTFSGASYSDFYGANNGILNMNFRKEDGTFDYAKMEEINRNSTVGAAYVLTKNRNYHNWVGLVSTYSDKFLDCLDFYGGIDLRYFNATHTNVISDMLSGDFYIDPTRTKSVSVENNKNAADINWLNEKLGVGDAVYRNYDAYITQGGLFTQLEYNKDKWSAFINGAVNISWYWRDDHFYYDKDNAKSDKVHYWGGNVKGGVNYNINDKNNVFVNAGYISRAPKFNGGAFMSHTTSNAINKDAVNEKIISAELGYSFHNRFVNLTLNGYYTDWLDKTMTKSGTLGSNNVNYQMNMTGVDARHMGVEFEAKIKPVKWFELSGMFSIGSWKWTNDSVKGYAYSEHGQAIDGEGNIVDDGSPDQAKAIINMKDIHVGGSAQLTGSLGMMFNPFEGFRFGGDYTLYANNYAYYSISSSSIKVGGVTDIVEPWKIPIAGTLDLRASYSFPIGAVNATLIGNVNNVLNLYYIEKAFNPSSAKGKVTADDVYVFFSQGRTWSISLKLTF